MNIGGGINFGPGITISNEAGPSLYDFTVFNFTNAGATGNVGPTLAGALSSYDSSANTWLNNASYYNVTGGVQYWTVPATGSYTVETWGANGAASSAARVGKGAYVKGTFTLTQGEIIRIAVGQQGIGNVARLDFPGGGGSFVVRSPYNSNASILTVAGGGAGVSSLGGTFANAAGATTTTGNASPSFYWSGNSGNGAGSSNQTVQGGAGFFTNGFNTDGVQFPTNDLSRPRSFTNASPLLGGAITWSGATTPSQSGGFGGGGGTNRNGIYAMGGGGGYSGGAGGYNTTSGGGGGSYNTGTNQTMTSNVKLGHGQVTITRIS